MITGQYPTGHEVTETASNYGIHDVFVATQLFVWDSAGNIWYMPHQEGYYPAPVYVGREYGGGSPLLKAYQKALKDEVVDINGHDVIYIGKASMFKDAPCTDTWRWEY